MKNVEEGTRRMAEAPPNLTWRRAPVTFVNSVSTVVNFVDAMAEL